MRFWYVFCQVAVPTPGAADRGGNTALHLLARLYGEGWDVVDLGATVEPLLDSPGVHTGARDAAGQVAAVRSVEAKLKIHRTYWVDFDVKLTLASKSG